MVAIFPKLCFWRRSLCSHLRGIDPEKLYRATLNGKQPCSYLFSAENLERGMNYLMGLIENDPVPFIRQVTLV